MEALVYTFLLVLTLGIIVFYSSQLFLNQAWAE